MNEGAMGELHWGRGGGLGDGCKSDVSGGEKRRPEKRVRSQVTATAHGAKYCGPSTVPLPMRDRPPQRGLRPPLLPNSVWVL